MSATHSLAEIQGWKTHWNSPTCPVRASEAKQATEQTCSLEGESVGPRATAPHFQLLSVCLSDCREECSALPLSRRHKAELKPGDWLTAAELWFHCYGTKRAGCHPLRPCPRLQFRGKGAKVEGMLGISNILLVVGVAHQGHGDRPSGPAS